MRAKYLTLLVCFLVLVSGFASLEQPPEAVVEAPPRDRASAGIDVGESGRTGVGTYEVLSKDGIGVTGFEFVNRGGNRVLPVAERGHALGPNRLFSVRFKDRARQDIIFKITDKPTQYFSDRMESYFYFFPRKVIPAIQWPTDSGARTFTVVLPTEERVEFNQETKEMVSGPILETTPVDLNPNRNARKFPAIRYTGTGVYLRVNKRGGDPRLGTTATVYAGDKTCSVPSAQLFDQSPGSAVVFLYPTDQGFNDFLKKKCGISFLP